MSAQYAERPERVDELPALPLLEGLARIHRWILVIDSDRRVVWTSAGLSELPGVEGIRPGVDAREFLAMLPRPEQVFPLRSNLRGRSHLMGAPLELVGRDGETVRLDIDLIRVDSRAREFVIVIASEHREDDCDALDGRLVDALRDAFLAIDEQGFVRRVNRAACRLLGAEASQLLARPVSTLLARGREEVDTLASLLTGPVREGELELRLADAQGRQHLLHVSVAPLGAGLRALLLRDRTAERGQIEALQRSNEELEHTIGAVAHDLRSPLVGLLGFSRLLRQDYGTALDDTGRHFIDRIEQGARTMERLIHDLLELARIGAPGETPSLVDAHSLLRLLASELKPRLDQHGIELCVVDGTASPIYCDRARLYQLFSNLVGNAIEHMGPRAGARIEVEIREAEGEHEIVVADNGRGVDPAHRSRIFETFQSFGKRSDGERGTGMGLAIVKRIAEKYGGRVWFEEAPGGGAGFHVALPRP